MDNVIVKILRNRIKVFELNGDFLKSDMDFFHTKSQMIMSSECLSSKDR